MSYKLKLNQIRAILSLEVKLESAKTTDGSIVNYERLEAGFPIFQEDGTTPLAEGDYTLEDGTAFKVDADGLIMEVIPPTETPEAPEAPETEVTIEAAEPSVDPTKPEEPAAPTEEELMKKIADDVKTCMEAIVALADEVAQMKSKLQMAEQKVNEFAKQPATTKIPKVSVPDETKVDRMESIINVIKHAMSNKK